MFLNFKTTEVGTMYGFGSEQSEGVFKDILNAEFESIVGILCTDLIFEIMDIRIIDNFLLIMPILLAKSWPTKNAEQ